MLYVKGLRIVRHETGHHGLTGAHSPDFHNVPSTDGITTISEFDSKTILQQHRHDAWKDFL